MLASLVKGLCSNPHSPGRKPYLSRVKRITPAISLSGVRREVSKLLAHQAVQLTAVTLQVIQHLGHRRLHRLERLVPAVERLLPQELPPPLDQVQIGRVGRQEHQVELPMAGQPLLHHRLAVVLGIVQVEDELLRLGMLGQQLLQELDELLAGDVLRRQAEVHVVVIVRAVSPQDVQAFAAVADADVMPLPDQEPAAVEQVQAPDRMAGVHEVATSRWPRLTPVPPIRAYELTLLLPVRLPEKSPRPCGSWPRCDATGPSHRRWSR